MSDPFQIRKDAARRQADDFLRSLPEGRHKVPVERVDPAVRGSGLRLYDRRYVARMALAMDADPKLRTAPTRFAVHADGQVRQVDGAHRYAARHMRGEAKVPIQIEHRDTPAESKALKQVYRPAKARLQRARRARDRGMERERMERLATRVPRWADPVNETLSSLQKSMRLPSGERVRFRTNRMWPVSNTVKARVKGQTVGRLGLRKITPEWMGKPWEAPPGSARAAHNAATAHLTGTVSGIEVLPEFQRKGVATGMWREAKARGLNPRHTPYPEQFSPEGKAWAAAVGKSYLGEGVWGSASEIPSQTRKVMMRGYRNAAKARAEGRPNLPAEPSKRLPARAYVAGKGMGNVVSANAEHVQFRPDSHDAVYHLNRKAVSFRRAKKRR